MNDIQAMGKFTMEQLFTVIDKIPICVNVINENADSVYCNEYTVNLYDIGSRKEYIDKFYELTPEFQPNGKNSKQYFAEQVLVALENGKNHFNWLDIKLNGEEIPLFISVYRLNTKDSYGNELLVTTMEDLRPQLAGFEDKEQTDGYYYNRITYRDLFKNVAELTDEWFWIYDCHLKTIQFFGKGREILGLSAEKQPFPSYVVNGGMVNPEDLDAFMKFDYNLKNGIVEPCEVRFISPNGEERYYRIKYKTKYDNCNKPIFSIGKTYDIDDQKRLEVLSKTDLLTNCLNKITTEDTIKEILKNSNGGSHALFLIDVDDFKSVNDNLGHYFGDITLSDISKSLQLNFRDGDIVGRIGGDEFLVLLKDVSDETIIKRKAKSITKSFKNSYSGENSDYKISGSIGIAIYPKHATTYEGLYKCADKALYSSKADGKDRFTIYSDDISNSVTKQLTEVDQGNKPINAYYDSDITTIIFDTLYEAADQNQAMNIAIKMLGTLLNANRCYISQTFDNGITYSITHEWTSSQCLAKRDEFQNVDANTIKDMFYTLEKNGIMSSNDIINTTLDGNELDLSYSYLLMQTKGKGYKRIVFGIEDGNKHRVWSDKEINTIQYVVKMISLFLKHSNND